VTEYERVTYRPDDLRRGTKTIYLWDVAEVDGPILGSLLTGVEVDVEGVNVGTETVSERRHVIATDLVTKRVPVVMDMLTGLLTVSRDLP